MTQPQRYKLRSPSTGKEKIVAAEPGQVYVDRETGEQLEIVSKILPLSPSPSTLPWTLDTLRLCGCSREQPLQNDLNDCPYCGKRVTPVADGQ